MDTSANIAPESKTDTKCPGCGGINWTHWHDAAHGIAGTHMSGTERFECQGCGKVVYKREGTALGLRFVLD